ncbi:MAG: hypothetical protein QNK11_03285 [Legionella sp.]|nr:hypothetical protein [Legionella sp.]
MTIDQIKLSALYADLKVSDIPTVKKVTDKIKLITEEMKSPLLSDKARAELNASRFSYLHVIYILKRKDNQEQKLEQLSQYDEPELIKKSFFEEINLTSSDKTLVDLDAYWLLGTHDIIDLKYLTGGGKAEKKKNTLRSAKDWLGDLASLEKDRSEETFGDNSNKSYLKYAEEALFFNALRLKVLSWDDFLKLDLDNFDAFIKEDSSFRKVVVGRMCIEKLEFGDTDFWMKWIAVLSEECLLKVTSEPYLKALETMKGNVAFVDFCKAKYVLKYESNSKEKYCFHLKKFSDESDEEESSDLGYSFNPFVEFKLEQSGLNAKLEEVKTKKDNLTGEAKTAAEKLVTQLTEARETYLASGEPLKTEDKFIESCCDAIQLAQLKLEKQQGWKQILLDLVNILLVLPALYYHDRYRFFRTEETKAMEIINPLDKGLDAFRPGNSSDKK